MSEDELARLDDLLAGRAEGWWDAFYEDRTRLIPFFVSTPDESLTEWIDSGNIPAGRAIDLGCGNGRNAVFLARRGFTVEAVDYSQAAIEWARRLVADAGVDVRLRQQSVFDLNLEEAGYDLIYDAGCFHHVAPHRRSRYVERVGKALRKGGWFGLSCFRPEGGSGYSDEEVHERRSLGGGLG